VFRKKVRRPFEEMYCLRIKSILSGSAHARMHTHTELRAVVLSNNCAENIYLPSQHRDTTSSSKTSEMFSEQQCYQRKLKTCLILFLRFTPSRLV